MILRRAEERAMAPEVQILLVDDDADFLELLSAEICQIPGVRTDAAMSPDEALRLLSRQDYDLIVSDWALESSTASEIFTRADGERGRRTSVKTPVVFISGSDKVEQTQILRSLRHFEPVSFLLKRCGPSLIGLLAQHLIAQR